ncbi:HEPN domain-containing protein [Desulfopila inferna]|uniref:HEPN domain-containing protein n=1 Tax=Desulfopila inferna TaxID=468528 RepID=UPI00196571A7|nr:HEPN domain-containing protein [Desulfopila inferna]MBM9604109.1 hypothetical protein [Desulfopila inferna]
MEILKFTIASKTQFESDQFLRCLWSQFRSNFDNYGWNYWGVRSKNVVDLGMLSLGLKHPVHIQYDYEYKGRINNLYINVNKEDISGEISKLISKCVSKSIKSESHVKGGFFSTKIETYYEIQCYDGSNFRLEKTEYGANLTLGTFYFDEIDCKQEFAIKTTEIKKLLSLAFNLPIFSGANPPEKIKVEENLFTEELKTIDTFLKTYDSTSEIYNKTLEAISLYQNGLKIIYNNRKIRVAHPSDITENYIKTYIPASHQELLDVHQKINIDIELAIVSLISALEVAASIQDTESKICPTCNQQVYKIAQKVKSFSKEFGNEGIEYNIKNAYSIRSQIVHAGILLERNEALQNVVNPRIDLSQNGKLLNLAHSLPELLLDDVRLLLLNYIKYISKEGVEH